MKKQFKQTYQTKQTGFNYYGKNKGFFRTQQKPNSLFAVSCKVSEVCIS